MASTRVCKTPGCDHAGRFHRDEPSGYVAWHEWAERMSRTHHQERCPGCGLHTVWRRGPSGCLLYR